MNDKRDAIAAIANYYCIQRDPRATAAAMAAVAAECARRLCEGHVLRGESLEAEVLHGVMDDRESLSVDDVVNLAASCIEMIALLRLNEIKEK